MKYPFDKFKVLLDLYTENFEAGQHNQPFDTILKKALEELHSCRNYFQQQYNLYESEQQLKQLIQNCQQALVQQSDYVFRLQEQGSPLPETIEKLLLEMESLLDDIAQFFPDWFNKHLPAPLHYIMVFQKAKTKHLVHYREIFFQKREQFEQWSALFVEMEKQIQCLHLYPTSFHQLHFISQLLQLKDKKRMPIVVSAVFSISELYLLEQGYNEEDFLDYLLEKMKTAAENAVSVTIYWEEQRKLVLQLRKKNNQLYQVNQPDCFTELLRHIEAEVLFLQNIQSQEKIVNKGNTDKLIPCKFSVGQLALLMRLFVEQEWISPDNQTEFFQLIASSIMMGNKGQISPQSLRNKYYTPDKASIKAVKDLLYELLKELGRMEASG